MVARRTAQVRITSPGVTMARTALAATAGGLATRGGAKDPVPTWVKNDRQVKVSIAGFYISFFVEGAKVEALVRGDTGALATRYRAVRSSESF